MTKDYIEEKEEGLREALKDKKCNCPTCRKKRGEKVTLSRLRHESVNELRKKMNQVLKKYRYGIDGWAFAISCLEDSHSMGLAENRFAMVSPSHPSIACAAHLAAQAISEIMDTVHCNQADAEQIFKGKMLEALHPTLAKKASNKMPDLLRGLMGLDALLGEPQEKKPAEEKPADKAPEPVKNLITT
jgi:hypothetical protein